MDIDERTAQKERLLAGKKISLNIMRDDIPYFRDNIPEAEKEIETLEDEIKHLRKVQLAEAKTPRKESLLDNIWVYIIVGIFVAVISGLIVNFFIL